MGKENWKGCTICVYMQVEPDPDPTDWFNDDDVKARCTMCLDTSKGGPFITTSCRPYMIDAETENIPKWCPCNRIPVPKPEFMTNFNQFYLDELKKRSAQAHLAETIQEPERKIIDSFVDEYFFLSNFYPCKVTFLDVGTFNSTEALYQAMKCPSRAKEFIGLDPSAAKKLGRSVKLQPNWEQVKDSVMLQVLTLKFYQNPDLATKLLDTGNAILIEGNTWGDTYWGQVNGEGKNMLGTTLMKIRDELIALKNR